MKKVIRAAWEGLVLAAVVFLITCAVIGLNHPDESFGSGLGVAVSCLATAVIGVGFGIPSLIYATELPTGLKVLIHMGTGTVIMLATSIAVGWIDFSRGWKVCLLIAGGQIAVAFLLWALSCVRIRRDAKQMNERLKDKE
ncbi:MAG: DUF3021 domain-containing protein [Clostridiales bacterium]|nr:DUF3021 domain-containing protein [Clostridiales bacterium]